MTVQLNRRNFLKTASAATAASLVIGTLPCGTLAAATSDAPVNPFVRILPDGTVRVILKHFEMGQGTTTGLATLVAEELDADWSKVETEFAPADTATYKNLLFGAQGTGGSTAIANSFMQYRQAGAAAREMLVKAAAEAWGVDASTVDVSDSMIKSGNRSAHFGEMLENARAMPVPAKPKLKDPTTFKLIGKEKLPRQDTPGKTTGKATFALDVKLPGMVYAVIARPSRFGGTVAALDASGASDMAGFIDARILADNSGVAVYAKNTWAAIKAREAIAVTWDYSKAESRSTAELIDYHRTLTEQPMFEARKGGNREEAIKAVADADKRIEAEFVFPYLAHSPMEPLNCTIEPTETGVRVHDGCQFPSGAQPAVAATLQLKPENVEIRTVYAGGSFGRRATPTSDYHVSAALAFAAYGSKTLLQTIWTREDDIRGGYYRPMAVHKVSIGIDGAAITGWDHRVAVKSILKGTFFEKAMLGGSNVDPTSAEGADDTHYAIPAMSVGLSDAQTAIPILWWRSVGHTHTAYVMESLIDMIATEIKSDPVALRMKLLAGDDKDRSRLRGVLKLAAEKADWGKAASGRHQGIAVHKSFGTYVAQVVEVSIKDEAVKVEKITCAVDCGVAVNPDVIRAQMEGGIGYGLGAVMQNQITLTNGEVDQANFTDYDPLRIYQMPEVDVHIVASSEAPTGVGEPGVPPVGPALANAIFSATGKRILRLPMADNGVGFA